MKNSTKGEKQSGRIYLLMRISFGLIYTWYGMLKFFPGLSPAEGLAKETIHHLTFGIIPDDVSILLLATWEVGVGLLFLTNRFQRTAILLALVHMGCTFLPFLFMPELTFTFVPYGFTLVGQYIVKNLVFIFALLLMRMSLEKEWSRG